MIGCKAKCVASREAPRELLNFSSDTLPNFALGFFVIVLAVFEWRSILEDATTTLHTDNTSAFGAILNTGSTSNAISSVTMRLWYLIDQLKMWVWLGPVSSPLNIADLPTRDQVWPFPTERQTSFLSFDESYRVFTQLSLNDFLTYFDDII